MSLLSCNERSVYIPLLVWNTLQRENFLDIQHPLCPSEFVAWLVQCC